MAALYLHNAIFAQDDSPTPLSTLPHSRSLSSGTVALSVSTHGSYPTEPLLSSSVYQHLLSRQPAASSDGQQWDMSLSFEDGRPDSSPIERERRGYHEQSVRRRLRILKSFKVSLEIIVAVWATYNTVRYFLAYTKYSSTTGQTISLALGTSTAVSLAFLICSFIISSLHSYLIAKHIPIYHLLLTRTILEYLSTFFFLSPSIVNLVLTVLWKRAPTDAAGGGQDTELGILDRRCGELDVDLVWSITTTRECAAQQNSNDGEEQANWTAWLGLAIFRVVMTLLVVFSVILCLLVSSFSLSRYVSSTSF
ncbi:hypothetical protein K435DRAFT_791746 [Dendrothele bispora CBS 962.96]|uniref:Transmembrane protein n=1 Tax=Dendrothele bispora (strain CBS 962.96) TaxID=1314807 RepID=A0A4V4HHP7_DENBC|nr:hypothetical protein K435DRAFT_791746 [Dendrothele bispora CBS 962.96]